MTTLDFVFLAAMVLAAMATVMAYRLLWAIIGLAALSAVVTALLFRFNAPIAGVFELSVCAGLIPVIFISTISLTRRLSPEAMTERRKEKIERFFLLPVIVLVVAALLSLIHIKLDTVGTPVTPVETDVRRVLWHLRHIDLVGQLAILLGGAFAVVILLKEKMRDR